MVVVGCIAVVWWLIPGGAKGEPATARRRTGRAHRAPAGKRPPATRPAARAVPRAAAPTPAPALAPPLAGGEPAVPDPWWVRLRSAVLLGCLSTVLGVLAAALLGALVVVAFLVLQSSVG